MSDQFSGRLAGLAAAPGVYIFKNQYGGVLYVGKASSLRNRVRSYFQDSRSLFGMPKTRVPADPTQEGARA